jgi:hypothetical protein
VGRGGGRGGERGDSKEKVEEKAEGEDSHEASLESESVRDNSWPLWEATTDSSGSEEENGKGKENYKRAKKREQCRGLWYFMIGLGGQPGVVTHDLSSFFGRREEERLEEK